jgi:fibronectin-binding autotransporter adhesin
MFHGDIGNWQVRSNFSRRSRFARRRALAMAVAAVAGASTAHAADVSGFSTFGPVQTNTSGVGIGYSANSGAFTLTTAANNEITSGFTSSQINISSSFVAQFVLTANGGADGGAFVIQNYGQTAVGGGGGSGGYQGLGSSAGLEYEFFNQENFGFSTNGQAPTYVGQNLNFSSGDPTLVTMTYTSNPTTHVGSVGVQLVDLTTKQGSSYGISNVNIQSAIGGTSAFVGFTGATGGSNASQAISNFSFTNTGNLSYAPIAISSGFNQDMVIEKGASQFNATQYITASMDSGTVNRANNVWYEQGYDTAAPTTGLPPSGLRFTSQADTQHQFQMQSYNGNNVLLIGSDTGATATSPNVTSGTFTLTNPQAFTALSLLTATGNGPDTIDLTITYSDTHAASTITEVVAPDWFNSGAVAWNANGRVVPANGSSNASSFNSVNGGNPKLLQSDILLPDATDPISSITFTADSGGGRTAIFAVSGAATISGTLLYTGVDPGAPSNDGKWDTGNSYTFNTTSGGIAPAQFTSGAAVVFDDTANSAYHSVTVAAAGVLPSDVEFNNSSTSYTISGGPIIGTTALTLNGTGSGTVTLLNTNTFTGNAIVNSGTLIIGSGGSIASGTVIVAPAGTFTVAAGGQPAGANSAFSVTDNGIVNFNTTSQSIGALTGNGVVNLNGTALTAGLATAFNGSFGGTGGSLAFDYGTVTVNSPGALAGVTGGITVGRLITATASLIINDNSGSAGTGVTTTLGPSGSIISPDTVNATYAGNISTAASTLGTPVVSGGMGATLIVSGNIVGNGSILFSTRNSSTVVLSGASTFSGQIQISSSDNSIVDSNILMAGANNAFSPNAGINFLGGGQAASVVDVAGFNQSVAYLTGALQPYSKLYNNGGQNATLTISNGNSSSGPAVMNTTITEGTGGGTLAILKTGTGNQVFTGTNSYSGGTNIAGGTLTAAGPQALGYGNVTLSGGTLSLAAPTMATIVSGFPTTGSNPFVLTKSPVPTTTGDPATINNNVLQLTDTTASEANAAFTTNPVSIGGNSGFVASFLYTSPSNNTSADGITFTLQNDPRGNMAVGGTGGGLGYGPNNNGSSINMSASVQFNIYTGNTVGTAFATNGLIANDMTTGTVSLNDGNPHQITLVYNAQNQSLTEEIYEGGTNLFETVYNNVNFSSIVGGTSAYVGFTGGTGSVTGVQTVSNFSYGSLVYTPQSLTNTITVNQTINPSMLNLPVSGTSTFASVGALTINPGATLKLTSTGGTATNPHAVLSPNSLTFNTGGGSTYTGTLDIGTQDLDLVNTDVGTVTKYVASGYNLTGGANWSGPGIGSSAAASDSHHLTAVGVISNSVNGNQLYGSGSVTGQLFDGSNPGPFDVLVKYTYYGDANLDGKVDGSDYSLIDAGYASHGSLSGWYNGDFNYDGQIDGSDYALIDNAFNNQGSPQVASENALTAISTAQVASAVPEPASLGLIGLASIGLAARRRPR